MTHFKEINIELFVISELRKKKRASCWILKFKIKSTETFLIIELIYKIWSISTQ